VLLINPSIASNAPQMETDILKVSERLTSNSEMDDTKGGCLTRGAYIPGQQYICVELQPSGSPVTMSGTCKGSPLPPLTRFIAS
jgi:hypothetical protein